jgi:hypothetical protein
MSQVELRRTTTQQAAMSRAVGSSHHDDDDDYHRRRGLYNDDNNDDDDDGIFSDEDWLSDDEFEDVGDSPEIVARRVEFDPRLQEGADLNHSWASWSVDPSFPVFTDPNMMAPQVLTIATGDYNIEECIMADNLEESILDGRDVPESHLVDVELDADTPEGEHNTSTNTPSRVTQKKKRSHNTLEKYSKCILLWGHGKWPTLLTIGFAWSGAILSILARQSTEFLVFSDPLYLSPVFEPIERVGLVQMEICYNETFTENMSGCQLIKLEGESSNNDVMLSLSRLFVASSVIFGAFFTLFLTLSIFWESIKMRPIGMGLLITYALQSFTMLVFDSDVCRLHQCELGPGCYMCICASFCWLAACIVAARMDAQKIYNRRLRRREIWQARKARKAKPTNDETAKTDEYERKESNFTEQTVVPSETSSIEENELVHDPELGAFVMDSPIKEQYRV